jgi:hypothetical protein
MFKSIEYLTGMWTFGKQIESDGQLENDVKVT